MAKVITQEKHGSVGPSTFQGSRHGTIERQRNRPIDPKTQAQLNQRSLMEGVSSQWRTLTDEQRDIWRALGSKLTGNLTGSQAYNQVNAILVKCGLPMVTTPPSVPVFGRLTCAGLVADDTPRLQLLRVGTANGAERLIIEACRPLGQGIGYFNNLFRYVTVVDAPADGPVDVDFTAAYTAVFPVPKAGQRVVVRLTAMKNGSKDTPLQVSAIVADKGQN